MSKKNKLSFQDLRKANLLRDKEIYNDLPRWNEMQWACALSGEAGEAANKAKKLWKISDKIDSVMSDVSLDKLDSVEKNYEYERELLVDGIAEELADVLIYVDLFAQYLNVNLEDELIKKFNSKSKEIKSSVFL